MTVQTTQREYQRLRQVAREYRQRGYDVLMDPQANELPDFLATFRVDMLARSADENVIVEVRTQASLADAPELDAIAQALEHKPSWRFELVVTNPRDQTLLQFKDARSLSRQDISYRLQEAQQLSDKEHGEAALLLAWSAVEALLRYIAYKEGLPGIQPAPEQIAKSLFMYGVLDKEQYQTVKDVIYARNLIGHGYEPKRSLPNLVNQVLQVAEQLQNQYFVS